MEINYLLINVKFKAVIIFVRTILNMISRIVYSLLNNFISICYMEETDAHKGSKHQPE